MQSGMPDVARFWPSNDAYDIVIVGSGMGGGTLAYALKDLDARVLLLERGDFLPAEPENWDPNEVFVQKRYKNAEPWYAEDGTPFDPGTYYYVGGNTKFYGASLARFRRSDFEAVEHADGTAPAWFLSYDEMAPWYTKAESLYGVRGTDDDPTLPRADPFPHNEVPHEPAVARIATKLADRGLTPSHIPLGIHLGDGGNCIRCQTCDGFPCKIDAKADADVTCVRPAVASGAVELVTGAYVERVLTDATGRRATGVSVRGKAGQFTVSAATVVISGGAVNSAALLLRSASEAHPKGVANSSDALGRYYMVHNNSVMVGVNPWRTNDAVFQKTLFVNDFYERGTEDHPFPLGHIQLIGKLRGEHLVGQRPNIPKWALSVAARHSSDWWLFTEDLPDPGNRVTVRADGKIQISWRPNNTRAHQVLVREARKAVRAAGYPLVFSETTGIAVNSHQAGTVRAGTDPTSSVLGPDCQTHDVANLFVVDSSFFPSLPVINPALTIAANALRVAEGVAASASAP